MLIILEEKNFIKDPVKIDGDLFPGFAEIIIFTLSVAIRCSVTPTRMVEILSCILSTLKKRSTPPPKKY